MLKYVLPLAILAVLGVSGQFRAECEQPLHHGLQQCSNASSVRFHLDTATKRCLAFKYSGCGGNANNFKTYQECQSYCFPMDYFTCPGGSESVASRNGKSHCGGYEQLKCDSPDTFCLNGPFTGICCSASIRDKVNADYEKECGPGGKLKHQIDIGGVSIPLFGKSCDSTFCPSGTNCQQGNYFAYCCA